MSIQEVQYHRVGVKKTPRKKSGKIPVPGDPSLYYVLNRNVSLGQLSLTGNSVFTKNEMVEVEFQVYKLNTRLRLLGKITKTQTFVELKRVVFRGDILFKAVNKVDYDRLLDLDRQRNPVPKP